MSQPSNYYVPRRRDYCHPWQGREALGMVVITVIGSSAVAVFGTPALGAIAIPLLWFTYGLWRIRIRLSSEGVRVRNMLQIRQFFRWSEIDRFAFGRFQGSLMGGVYLRDGRFVHALALGIRPGFEKELQLQLDELNGELARARELAEGPSSDTDRIASEHVSSSQVLPSGQMSLDTDENSRQPPELS